MDRRNFLRSAIVVAGGTAMLPTAAMASPRQAGPAGGPYGNLEGRPPDENGLILPEGFTSRVVAVAGEPVAGTGYEWPVYPDGAATFDDGEGGWRYVCNSEVREPGLGGVSAVHFGPDGEILDATVICEGTIANCAGGPTPWGTWLTCEEPFDETGLVYECDPAGGRDAVALPALGRWDHEAAAVDPEDRRVYLTQDHPDGLLYRFTPDAYPSLRSGLLEAAAVDDDDEVTWLEIPDPSGESEPTRTQASDATVFPGNEGIWYHDGAIVFTSKLDNRVHRIDLRAQRHEVLWDGTTAAEVESGAEPRQPLFGVDNVTVEAGSGDVYVAEDGGNMELVLITAEGRVLPFVRVDGEDHEGSEMTGPVFNPAGDRLYFSSQRGPTPRSVLDIVGAGPEEAQAGITYEVRGPFRGASPASASSEGDEAGGGIEPWTVGLGGGATALAGGAAAWWLHSRRQAAADEGDPDLSG